MHGYYDNELKKAQAKLAIKKLMEESEEMKDIRKQLFNNIASDYKMQYDSFTSQGFSEEQAIELLKIKIKNEPAVSQSDALKNYIESMMNIFKKNIGGER